MRIASAILCSAFSVAGVAQEIPTPDYVPPNGSGSMHMGLGIGLDHGGFGVRMDVPVARYFAAVAGAGYALAGIGWNVGVLIRPVPDNHVAPYLTAMYGYNAVIKVVDAEQYDKIYYGPTFGAGIEVYARRNTNYWHVAVLVPVRPEEFDADLARLKTTPGIELRGEPPTFGISLGYHFGL